MAFFSGVRGNWNTAGVRLNDTGEQGKNFLEVIGWKWRFAKLGWERHALGDMLLFGCWVDGRELFYPAKSAEVEPSAVVNGRFGSVSSLRVSPFREAFSLKWLHLGFLKVCPQSVSDRRSEAPLRIQCEQ